MTQEERAEEERKHGGTRKAEVVQKIRAGEENLCNHNQW